VLENSLLGKLGGNEGQSSTLNNCLFIVKNLVLRETFGSRREEITVDGRRPHTESLESVFLTKYHSGEQIKKNAMCGQLARMGKGGEGEVHTGLCWGCMREGDLFEDLGVHGRI
jgi:hypothetical protein